MQTEPWNKLAGFFNTHEDSAGSDAMDNVLIAWPVIFNYIEEIVPTPRGEKILDFGCGAGQFAAMLDKRGFSVVGVDSSSEMISIAKQHSPKTTSFHIGDISILDKLDEHFHVSVSIMVFQFVQEIDQYVHTLAKYSRVIICAVFNPDFVQRCLKEGVFFKNFSTPLEGELEVGGITVHVYIRTAQEYDEIFAKNGFKKIGEDYPPFPAAFIKKYAREGPADTPEFMILTYKKESEESV